LVRAAALAALGELGCGEVDLIAVEQAPRAPAWQVREGAARDALSMALKDDDADVRTYARRALECSRRSSAGGRQAHSALLTFAARDFSSMPWR
jgi:HEAT repeat protein